MENKTKKQALLVASMAGLMLMAGAASSPAAHAEDVPCYGINKCKGAGACAGKEGCAGKNSCKGHGFVKVTKEACLAIQGGSLTPVQG